MHLAESSSTSFCLWTGLSLPVALHLASQRRSYLQLRTGQCSRPEGTFTLLLVRTFRRTFLAPSGRITDAKHILELRPPTGELFEVVGELLLNGFKFLLRIAAASCYAGQGGLHGVH